MGRTNTATRHALTTTSAPLVTQRTLHVHGTDVFYEDVGEGAPIVLLHGLSDSHRTWRKIVPLLAKTRRVLVPDLPGCGLSGRPDASYTLDWQARVMAAWLDKLGLSKVDLVGHSYGGGVAQYMLLLEPQRIRRLVLVAAGGLGREVAFELRLASLPRVVEMFGQPFVAPFAARALRNAGGLVDADQEKFLREVNARPGTARAFARTVRDVINWRGQRRHFLDRAREVERLPPTAIFWGCRDRVIPYTHAHSTLVMMRGSTLTTFEGCGHFPHHECPERFVQELGHFFDARHATEVECVYPETTLRQSLRARLAARIYRWLRPQVAGGSGLGGARLSLIP